uniref:SCP domain-containing protein n=1 Tax=Mesocestoides corti TaxID=53468 RepID=A0A5K3FNB1_MESCO
GGTLFHCRKTCRIQDLLGCFPIHAQRSVTCLNNFNDRRLQTHALMLNASTSSLWVVI